ncbi:AmmeMemoRadiSam system protein A [Trichloromonas sp.]|uniref:AmmeMemoRadiSam system protein A n=1 Tax=Trichloromonas sp. TaxID=3069249 RepID=UPI002A3A36B7|nr:AmmeMemoRadiSam system protein A [Trichloromonas sp.]
MEETLTPKEQEILLAIARQAVIDCVCGNGDYVEPREEQSLNVRRGCFVTIKQQGRLRGCIGNFQSELPLFKEVAAMVRASATCDPRFYPMKEEDLADFTIEISVLSPLEKIDDIEQIVIGRHGIYLEKGFYRGVLLPQVATERQWDRLTFLKQTCLKAGLASDAWKAEDCEIYLFAAQVFGEEENLC